MLKRHANILLILSAALFILGNASPSLGSLLSAESEHDAHVARFSEILRILNERYVDVEEVNYEKLMQAAIDGMFESLDPYSRFLGEEQSNRIREETSQEFGGIGIRIEQRDGRVSVIAPIANTPGERAGILPGDQIVGVEGEETTELTPSDMSRLLRGEPGTRVSITLFRPATEETIEVTIIREIITVESIPEAYLMDDGIGYILISRFGERTGGEFRHALARLEGDGMRGLLLDLRNNPGGLLSTAVDVAGQFFDRGEMILYTEGREREKRQEIRARSRSRSYEYPIVVLINSGSASASEIVAGALKDTGRAVIVGETSFGKGSIQRIESLADGSALRYTSARYFTPSGDSIHEDGITPDIEVIVPFEDSFRLLRQRSRPDLSAEGFRERFGFDRIEDEQLQTGIDALKSAFVHAGAPEIPEDD